MLVLDKETILPTADIVRCQSEAIKSFPGTARSLESVGALGSSVEGDLELDVVEGREGFITDK